MDTSSKCHDLFLSLTFLAWSRWGPAPYDHFGTFQESVTKPENHETNMLCSSMWHSLANLLCFIRFWARRVMSTIFENYMAICKRRLTSAKTQISTRTCTHHSYIPWSRLELKNRDCFLLGMVSTLARPLKSYSIFEAFKMWKDGDKRLVT